MINRQNLKPYAISNHKMKELSVCYDFNYTKSLFQIYRKKAILPSKYGLFYMLIIDRCLSKTPFSFF